MDCLFCAIVEGTVPSKKVYEDETAYAFLDISPLKRGHTLVVPKRHTVDVFEDDTTLAEIAPAIARVGRLLTQRLGADAFNVLANVRSLRGRDALRLRRCVITGASRSAGGAADFAAAPDADGAAFTAGTSSSDVRRRQWRPWAFRCFSRMS